MSKVRDELEKPLLLVTGANGQLGRAFNRASQYFPYFRWKFAPRDELDITLESRVSAYLVEWRPAAVINCAAYTNVERAESEAENAFLINEDACGFLGAACSESNALLVHFSTDYVFDGRKRTPYVEADQTNPLSVYGKSKLAGERRILDNCARPVVVRASWLFDTHGHNFYRTMIRLAGEHKDLRVVNDQMASPTWAGQLAMDISSWLVDILIHTKHVDYGLFHYSHEGEASWWEFASAIMEELAIDTTVLPIQSSESGAKAPRPSYSKLNAARFFGETGLHALHWREALKLCIESDR